MIGRDDGAVTAEMKDHLYPGVVSETASCCNLTGLVSRSVVADHRKERRFLRADRTRNLLEIGNDWESPDLMFGSEQRKGQLVVRKCRLLIPLIQVR